MFAGSIQLSLVHFQTDVIPQTFNIKSFQIALPSKGTLKSKAALKMNISEVTQALLKIV